MFPGFSRDKGNPSRWVANGGRDSITFNSTGNHAYILIWGSELVWEGENALQLQRNLEACEVLARTAKETGRP